MCYRPCWLLLHSLPILLALISCQKEGQSLSYASTLSQYYAYMYLVLYWKYKFLVASILSLSTLRTLYCYVCDVFVGAAVIIVPITMYKQLKHQKIARTSVLFLLKFSIKLKLKLTILKHVIHMTMHAPDYISPMN